MIKIKNLKKYFDNKCILDEVNLTINENEIHGLIGESGSGKSTLLNCISRLENFQEGSVMIDNIEMKDLSFNELRKVRKNIGMIFQGFSLVNRKNVFKNISLPMECWGIDKKIIKKRVNELAEIVGLKDKLYYKPEMLSGGQKQRVAIARALTQNPQILLCDECTSALDPANTESIMQLLKKLKKELGITIVIVTHEISIIQSLCDRVSILKNGKIVQTEYIDKMFLNKSEDLKILLGKNNITIPKKGITISFSALTSEKNRYIIYDLGKVINNKYFLINSSFLDTVFGVVFNYMINISISDLNNIKTYLENHNIQYEIMSMEDEQ